MFNLFTIFSRKNIENSIGIITSRFPIPTFIVCIFTLLLFSFIHSSNNSIEVTKAIFTFGITFFFSTGIALYTENNSKEKINILFHIIPIIYGIFIYSTIDIGTDWIFESMVYLALHLFGFLWFLFFAPYVNSFFKKEEEIGYTNYFSLTSWAFLMSWILWLALLALWFIAIGSIFALFEIKDWLHEDKIFAYWATISLGFSAPIYWLLHLPKKSEINTKTFELNKFFAFLIKYIGVPFIYIYFIILYAYSIKVLLNFSDWPKGMISWMVIGFSVFGYLNYIFSKPYEDGNALISYFRKYFPIIVMPQLLMLFYAIYLRVAQYDLTMNRYFIIIFGIWLFIASTYLILSTKKSLSIITASLALISFLISVWPWSVFSYPLHRQYNRLISNLEKAHILQEWIIYPLSSPKNISKELSGEIYSGIEYVCDFSECSLIKKLFKNELEDARIKWEIEWKKWNTDTINKYPGIISKWEVINIVTEKIKVQMSYSYDSAAGNSKYISYSTNYKYDAPYPINIEPGYIKLVKVYSEKNLPYEKNEGIYPYVSIDVDSSKVRYYKWNGIITEIPLKTPTELLKNNIPTTLDQSDLTFVVEWNGISIKLLLQNFAIKNPEYTWSWIEYYTINGIALIKE